MWSIVEFAAGVAQEVGDYYIDCERMPGAADLKGHEKEFIDGWLAKVQLIRDQQTKLFDYLLTKHPTDFTMLGQSCEDKLRALAVSDYSVQCGVQPGDQ